MPTNELGGREGSTTGARQQVAILFADIVGSTHLNVNYGTLAFSHALKDFFQRAEELQRVCNGQTVKSLGDGFMAIFPNVGGALDFATQLQRSLLEAPIVVGTEPLTVRIGLHAGHVQLVQTSYGADAFGADINVAARLTGLAQPGEVVLSEAVRSSLSNEQQKMLGPTERASLKGVSGVIEVSRVDLCSVAQQ